MSDQFKYLFTPLKVGSMTVRNRLLITAHTTLYTDKECLFTERDAYYFAERAKGGVGLMITGATNVHPTSTGGFVGDPIGYNKKVIPRYQLIAKMVHEHGGRILVQLNHSGHLNDGGVQDDWRQVWCPSPIPASGARETPKAMELEDIEELIESYAMCARYVQEGGMDGIELHSATGYLLQQFMSPFINKRTDEYGGNLENRMRLIRRVIDRIRRECGREFVMGIRVSGDEFVPGGMNLQDTQEAVQILEETGQLDFINVSGGSTHNSHLITANMHVPNGFLVPLAAAIKQVIRELPVFCVGRIVDPVHAEKILADGHADMVGMTRAHIADPEIANKAREGRLEDIRTCVSCNQGCRARIFQMRAVTCIQNVAAGREKDLGLDTIQPAAAKKTVMIVGGGVAGMEAARVAALRGHKVSLYERGEDLGGQVNIAAKGPGREEFGGIARNLVRQMDRLGVDVHLNSEVTPDLVSKLNPDAVVLATGSTPLQTGFTAGRPDLPGVPGSDQDNVLTVWDVLLERKPVGENVVFIDDDGHQQAASATEFLVDQGKNVEVLTRLLFVGVDLIPSHDQPLLYQRLFTKGITFTPHTMLRAIEGNTVVVYNPYNGKERRIEGVDTVVLAMGNRANDDLYWALKGKVKELHRIGDCVAPRKVANAIWDGNMVGRSI